jgi:nucleoside-diphosphate kinase
VERTLVIVKPDGVERGLAGDILARFERRGLQLLAAELRLIDLETAKVHYAEHDGKPFFGELLEFITRSPSLVMVLQGPADTIAIVRSTMGATNPADAGPGTIRGDLATSLPDNLVHGSDSPESAAREIALYFPDLA